MNLFKTFDFDEWNSIKNGPFIPICLRNNKEVNRPKTFWIIEVKEKVQNSLKAKYLTTSSIYTW